MKSKQIVEFVVKAASYVRGKKTYICMTLAGLVEVLFAFGYFDAPQRDALLKLFGGGAAMAFAAKVNRAVEALKSANNLTLLGKR